MTREEMRMAFWSDVFTTKLSDHLEQDALKIADQALAEFDKRFSPQKEALTLDGVLEAVGMKEKLFGKEIKETGQLGMTLDTENPWIKVGDKLPYVNEDIEILFSDNTTDQGWRTPMDNWFARQGSSLKSDNWERSDKPVIAWRHLPIKNEE